jgi:dTDP-4-dehydrorhamnose reductase
VVVGAPAGIEPGILRVLVTGAGGQLGTDLLRAGETAGHEMVGATRQIVDVSDRDAVMAAICGSRPDVVIHAAAWTAVDACESDPDRAWRVNALACRHVGEAARLAGAHAIGISTDYVFDGEKPEAYVEWDEPRPMSVYGRSKRAGELELIGQLPGAAIVRTSWVCGRYGSNMVKTILRLAEGSAPLRFVDDQYGCPTFTDDLAAMLLRLASTRRPGVFHVTNQGVTTWYGLAREVLEAAGHDPSRVDPIATKDLDPPRPAPRPANSVLDNAVLRMSGLGLLPDHRGALERTVRALLQG